jgi:hypothetical protein
MKNVIITVPGCNYDLILDRPLDFKMPMAITKCKVSHKSATW